MQHSDPPPQAVTPLSCLGPQRSRSLGRFRALARLSLHAGLMASGCVLSDPPTYGTVKQTPPYLDFDSAIPSTYGVTDIDTSDTGQITIDVRSEDAGEELTAQLFFDYDPSKPPPGTIQTRRLPANTIDQSRTISMTWQPQTAGCHQVTMVVTHTPNLNFATNQPIDTSDTAYATWWFNIDDGFGRQQGRRLPSQPSGGCEVMRSLLLIALAAVTSACSLTSLEEDQLQPAKNTCSTNDDCSGGVCNTSLGVCASTDGQFANILLEVTPPASITEYGGIGFLKEVKGLPLEGGGLSVDVDVVAKVTGSVEPTKGGYSQCILGYGADQDRNTAPVKVTFTPSVKLLGLSTPQYTTTTTWNQDLEKYEFEAWMPADTYDVYIEPDSSSPDYTPSSCTVAPELVQLEVLAGDFDVPLVLQAPSLLAVQVSSPVDLEGWSVEIIHPQNGKLLSATTELKKSPELLDEYIADVEYTRLEDPAAQGTEVVRIRPKICPAEPDSSAPPCVQAIGPTLVVERAAIEGAKAGEGIVNQLSNLDAAKNTETGAKEFPWVSLQGVSLLAGSGYYDGSATVRFVSTDLDLTVNGKKVQGVQAFFDTTIDTDNGVLGEVKLLPGAYDVYVAPTVGSGYATTHATLLVSAGTKIQNGKTIELEHISHVGGIVSTGDSKPAVGAEVQAGASPLTPTQRDIWVGTKPFKPQALSSSVDKSGGFVLEADPGTLDFSVRPAEGTAFPWLVRPNVNVQSGAHELGTMQIGWPVIYDGMITLPTQVGAGGALVRAYIYLKNGDGGDTGYTGSRDGANAVLQVAETRADEHGAFQLFLPPHIN